MNRIFFLLFCLIAPGISATALSPYYTREDCKKIYLKRRQIMTTDHLILIVGQTGIYITPVLNVDKHGIYVWEDELENIKFCSEKLPEKVGRPSSDVQCWSKDLLNQILDDARMSSE